MHPLIENNIQSISDICQLNHVEELYIFGSITGSHFSEESDIDFLVSFTIDEQDLETYTESYFNILFALEELFVREIDLLTELSIKNPLFKAEIDTSKQLVFTSLVRADSY